MDRVENGRQDMKEELKNDRRYWRDDENKVQFRLGEIQKENIFMQVLKIIFSA